METDIMNGVKSEGRTQAGHLSWKIRFIFFKDTEKYSILADKPPVKRSSKTNNNEIPCKF
jgi:hypothetical protein